MKLRLFRNSGLNKNEIVKELHFQFQQDHLPPLQAIAPLLQLNPMAAKIRGSDGWLLLHRVCRRNPSVELIRTLVDAYPQSIFEYTGDGVVDLGARLPIHLLAQYGGSKGAVIELVNMERDLMEAKCYNHGLTPLDYAFKCLEAHLDDPPLNTLEVIEFLESSVPPHKRRPRPTYLPEVLPIHESKLENMSSDKESEGNNDSVYYSVESSDKESESNDDSVYFYSVEGYDKESENNNDSVHSSLESLPPTINRGNAISSAASLGLESFSASTTGAVYSSRPRFRASRCHEKRTKEAAAFLHAEIGQQNREPSLESIQKYVKVCPKSVQLKTAPYGYLAIHEACFFSLPISILSCLLNAWPESLKEQTDRGYLPLHIIVQYRENHKTNDSYASKVQFLLNEYPEAALKPDREGMLPLHYACISAVLYANRNGTSTGSSDDTVWAKVIQELVENNPNSFHKKNKKGQTPFSLLMTQPHSTTGSSTWNLNYDALRVLKETEARLQSAKET